MQSGASTPEARGDLTGRFRSSRRSVFSFFDRESLDQFCERGILASVLALLVWAPIATGATRDSQFLVLMGLGVLMCVFWLVRIWIRDQYRMLLPPFTWLAAAFVGYAIWRYSHADYEFGARRELLQIILYGLVFFAVLDNLTSQENIQIVLFTLIGLAMLNAFYGIFQYFTDSKHVLWFNKPPEFRGRGSGTYVCPNHLAGFLEMLLPVALAYTVTGRSKPLVKVFLGYSALVLVAGIGVTLSRGGYLATAAALIVFFSVLLWNRDFRLPAIGLLALLLATAAFFGFRSWQAEKRFSQVKQYHMRVLYWKPAVAMWKENFWTGVGPQHYDWRLRKWRHWQLQNRPVYVHNDYLNTVAEYGTVGGLLVAGALGALGWSVLRSWKYVRRSNDISSKSSNRSAVVFGCAIGLLAIVFHSVTDFNMHIPANALLAVTLMAILISHIRFATERFWIKPGIVGRLVASLVILCGLTYFAWQISRLAPQTYLLGKYNAQGDFKEQLALLERAYSHEPANSAVTVEIGELLRRKSFEAEEGWEEQARAAIPWFEKSAQLNRWNPFAFTNLGMCYDWLGNKEKGSEYFDKALALDPQGYFTLFLCGWHKLQLGELEQARKFFQDSYNFNYQDTQLAKSYLDLVDSRLADPVKAR